MYRKPLYIQDDQHGFTLVQYDPNGPIEIWHRYSDVLKHSAPDWMDAFRWTKEHRTVPRVARMWPAQFESWWLSGNGQPPKLFVDHEIDRVYDLRQLREMMARGRQPLPPLPIPPQPKEPSLQPPPIDKVKLTPTQTRVLRLIDELTDEAREQWTGSRFTRLPRRERRRPTLNVLQRYGLIEWGCKRMGAGISHSYWRLTKAGRKVLRTAARSGQISGS